MTGGLIVIIGIISMVMVHEAGHFFAAKATGMKATEFFFGFGPKLWSTRRGETEYGIKALPLGGYVRIIGMNPYEEVDPGDESRTYRVQPFWAKSVVVLAGVVSHFVIAFLLFFVVATAIGYEGVTTTIQAIDPTMADGTATPAAGSDLRAGDTIVSIDGVPIEEWDDVRTTVRARPVGYLGVMPTAETLRRNPVAAMVDAGASVGRATADATVGMWRLFSGLGDLIGATISGDTATIDDHRPASPIGLVRVGAQTQQFGIGFTL